MQRIYQLKPALDREAVFRKMHIVPEQHNYVEFEKAYRELSAEIPSYLRLRGTFLFDKAEAADRIHQDLSEVSHMVFVLVTLGRGISARSTEFFEKKNYLKGLMLDTIADQLLFQATKDMYRLICREIHEKQGFALTSRYTPDDDTIPIRSQKLILERISGTELLGVSVTEGCMYDPLKTLGYVYGADRDMEHEKTDHDCACCSNTGCEFRNTMV